MKSNVFIRGFIILFVLVLSNNLFAISDYTIRILKEPQGLKVIDSKGNIHIVTMETGKYYDKKIVGIDKEKNEYITEVGHISERDTIFYTYELLDSLGNVIVPRRRLCKAKQGGHTFRGDYPKGLFAEIKPSGPIIVGGSESGFDSYGMLRIMELDKMGNIIKMHRPNADCPAFNLLWNGKELFYLSVNKYTFLIYKQIEDNFVLFKINLEDLRIKKIGVINHWVSQDFGSFVTDKGNIVVLMRSTDPDDLDNKVHKEIYGNKFVYAKKDIRGRDIISIFALSPDGEIVSPIKKYNIKKVAFKEFTIVEEFTDGVPRLAQKGIGRRIVKKDTTIYAYFRGYNPETKKIDTYQLRLTPEGDIMKSKSLETEMIKPLEELPSGFPIYHTYFASYGFDDKGDMYILYKELKP
ncbi:hypothetical protein KAX75_05980 [candidate division WOR-3 bacterium]|nr:hypothetical protein [candidate division WOR-3 bacterium]